MSAELIYHDLIQVPYGWRNTGIYWLRLFHGESRYIAVVTEVPGNPSFSVTNGIEDIARHVIEEFQVPRSEFSLYQIHPRASTFNPTNIRRVTIDYSKDYPANRWDPSWDEVTRLEIERDIGAPLPELPVHEDLYPRVLDRGGGVFQNIYRDIFQATDVRDLPPFHNTSRCSHSGRFQRMMEEAGTFTFQDQLSVGRKFIESLTEEDRGSCYYHQADWKAIADESVRIIAGPGREDVSAYKRAAFQSQLQDRDRGWLVSLFDDPVKVYGGRYHNGQHRGCALRFSGAAQASVVVASELVERRCVDWHYRGGG
jgi:hypothetical protein